MRYLVISNGICPRRKLDVSNIHAYMKTNNHILVSDREDADCVLLMTCAFRNQRIDECVSAIKKYKKNKLIVLGCMPSIAPKQLKEVFVGSSISTKELDNIDQLFPENKRKFASMPDGYNMSSNAGGFLRVSWGCNNNCSYCGIRNAVGPLKSKDLNSCKETYLHLLSSGCKEITILADNVGCYGLDTGTDFAALLDVLDECDKNSDVKWIIQELHPVWAVKYADALVPRLQNGKIKEIGPASLQSGSERILKLMNRYSDCGTIRKTMRLFRDAGPKCIFWTHLIVGFPTETEDDLMESIKLAEDCCFNLVELFPFYPVQGTEAALMQGQIPTSIVRARIRKAAKILESKGISVRCEDMLLTSTEIPYQQAKVFFRKAKGFTKKILDKYVLWRFK